MTLFSSLKRVGIYAKQLSDFMNFLIWVGSKHTRIKRNWGELNMASTGWDYGIPRWDPE
jgi:hypothetical protein